MKLGYEITHNWTQVELIGERTPELHRKYANYDIDGIHNCDILLIMDDDSYSYRG